MELYSSAVGGLGEENAESRWKAVVRRDDVVAPTRQVAAEKSVPWSWR